MANQTDRFDLQTFDDGETNWDHTDTVEALDELAIDRGPIAARPSTGSYDDELYLATDQRILWRWDANAADWKAGSGLGSESQPVPGTSHFEALEAESLVVDDTYHYAADDAELSEILPVSDGDTIVLGTSDFSEDRTFNNRVTILSGSGGASGAMINDASWTFADRYSMLIGLSWAVTSSITFEEDRSGMMRCSVDSGTSISVQEDSFRFVGCLGGNVTFESETSDGIVDGCTGTTVQDDGSNTVGDIA